MRSMNRYLPNTLTLLRFPLTGLFLYGSFHDSLAWRLAATLFFLLSMLTDLLDGYLARRMGSVTSFGSFLDPLADKVLVLSGFFVLLARPGLHWGDWSPWVTVSVLVIVLREIAVTILRSYRVKKSRPIVTSMWGKAKTTTQMIALVAALLVLNLRESLRVDLPELMHVIALGIIASAVLAAISATDYFRESSTTSLKTNR